MKKSRKKYRKAPSLQPLSSEIETVAAGLGMAPSQVTMPMLEALEKGLENTTSPLKDAVSHLLRMRRASDRHKMLMEEWHGILIEKWNELDARPLAADPDPGWMQGIERRHTTCLDELEKVLYELI